jgi:hypothetical protein
LENKIVAVVVNDIPLFSTEMASLSSDGSSSIQRNAIAKREIPNNAAASQKLMCALVLVLISVFTMTRQPELMEFYSDSQGHIVAKLDDIITVPLKPKVEKIQGVDHYYLLPLTGRPKGILIFFHSCGRSGSSFFHLPEERIIAYDALQRGVAVFAPTSRDRESGCWTQMDLSPIEDVVGEWAASHDLYELPRMGMGDSSGASYLFFVYKTLQLRSMAVYNSPQLYYPDDMELGLGVATAFVTMLDDENMSAKAVTNYEKLRSFSIPTQLYKVTPHPFTSEVCMARFAEFENEDCDKLLDAIRKELPHLLDRRWFVKDTLTSDEWESFFSKLADVIDYQSAQTYYLKDAIHPQEEKHAWVNEAIQQEIKSCQGFHALSSEHHSSVLNFLMQEAGVDTGKEGEDKNKDIGDP